MEEKKKKVTKRLLIIAFILNSFLWLLIGCVAMYNKKSHEDFTVEETQVETTGKYIFLEKQMSDYICELSEKLELDSDLAVSVLMVENPEFDKDAVHRNLNGTIDVGLYQLNDRYLWTVFKNDYWLKDVELDPFNWKHNAYIALHHLSYLQKKLKVQDDVIMAYNCGRQAVMDGVIPDTTVAYLARVKNNYMLLKNQKE